MPAPRSALLGLAGSYRSPKWKIEAASTALARPSRMPSTRWSSVPTPPDAMTGTGTASAIARVRATSIAGFGAVAVHRGQQDFARTEIATSLRIVDRVDAPSALRPPWVKISQRGLGRADTCLASIATTTHCAPNFSAALAHEIAGRCTAAVLIDTLSAPASSSVRMSSTRAHAAADRQRHEAALPPCACTTSKIVPRSLVAGGDVEEAEFVRTGRVIGHRRSRPDRRHRADRRNCTPLTTRPSLTSRQGMTRTFSIRRAPLARAESGAAPRADRCARHTSARPEIAPSSTRAVGLQQTLRHRRSRPARPTR